MSDPALYSFMERDRRRARNRSFSSDMRRATRQIHGKSKKRKRYNCLLGGV